MYKNKKNFIENKKSVCVKFGNKIVSLENKSRFTDLWLFVSFFFNYCFGFMFFNNK